MVAKLISILNNSCLSANQTKQIHAYVIINILDDLEPLLIRQILTSTYGYHRSSSHYVQKILYHSKNSDAFSWGYIIRFFSQHDHFKEALRLYVQMQRFGVCPSTFAVSSALKACARTAYKTGGLFIHSQSCKYGLYGCVYVQTALVGLYSELGDVNAAQKVFDEMVDKNVVSWNSILSGYSKCGNLVEARRAFDQIPKKDVISWNSIVSGFARIGDMEQAEVLFQQMPERNCTSWNAMISGYVDCGSIELARKLFDTMPQRNNVSWIIMIAGYSKCGNVESAWELFNQNPKKNLFLFNAMISCFAQNSRPEEALQLFNELLESDRHIQPDKKTLVGVISSCSQLGDARYGSWIESYMKSIGLEIDDHLVTALVDLYAKCGSIDRAYRLFHCLKKKDVVAYSAMIWGCGINGKVADAMKLFEVMLDDQIRPNLVTFTGLLTACNHAGLVDEGYQCFNSMRNHELLPSVDHYAIMVDLLGRAGRLREAYELIKSMPKQPHTGIWGALLLACSVHHNVEIGEIAAQHCFVLEPNTTGYYSLLANIYASVGRWDDSRRVRKEMKEKKLAKMRGCSWMASTRNVDH